MKTTSSIATTVLTTILLLWGAPCNAQISEPPHTSPLLPSSGLMSVTYYDGYLANRINRFLYTDPTIWYRLGLKWKSGIYFDWTEIHGTSDSDWSNNAGDETQVTVGYAGKISTLDFKLEATLINIHPVEDWFNNDRLSLDVYVSKTYHHSWCGKHAITPEFRAIWFSDTQYIESGVPIIMPTLHHKWSQPFGIDVVSIQTRLAVCWDGGLYKNDSDGIFLQADTSLAWKIGKATTVTFPGIKLFVPLTSGINDGRQEMPRPLLFFGITRSF